MHNTDLRRQPLAQEAGELTYSQNDPATPAAALNSPTLP